jgi:mono/diheme cytochrome c family protein
MPRPRSRALARAGTPLVAAVALLAAALAPACGARADAPPPSLRFLRDGAAPRDLALPALVEGCGAQTVRVVDPYYAREKRFHAVPLGCALALGFGAPPDAGESVLLRARDGYVRPTSFAALSAEGGWLAFSDAELATGDPRDPAFRPAWEPIDRRHLDPGPFYLVWSGAGQRDPHRTPWPYQLAEIELAPLERLYPHTVPVGAAPDSAARRGFAIFRDQCIACHAINGEGGTVGPDLNVPRSIVEYRPAEQIKAYVRDPGSFRYTTMPAHRDLTEADLDALVAYFEAMSRHKRDPGRSVE